MTHPVDEAIPTPEACRVLMEDTLALPDAVVRHCRAVAEIARALGEAVNRAGGNLNLPLITAAALVHDIGRRKEPAEPHDRAGARLLAERGYPRMAAIVAVHMKIDANSDEPLSEAEIVHLADKLVSGDQSVDLDLRFRKKMKKYGKDPATASAIRQREATARLIETKVERIAGRTVRQILRDAGIFGE